MERLLQAVRAVPPRFVLAASWLVLLVYAYPGRMTAESFEYLRQARTKFYAPENPPAVSGLWRLLEWLVAGPSALLFVQSLTFVAGAFCLLRRALPDRSAAWATCALVVFPPVLVPLGVIWSHSLMAGFLMLGIAALLADRRGVRAAGLASLLLATALQPTAALATLPPILLVFTWRATTGVRRYVIALATWLAITSAALGLDAFYAKRAFHPSDLVAQVADPSEIVPAPPPTLDIDALKYGVPTRTTVVQDTLTAALTGLADHTPLFSPWLYLALALGVVALGVRQRDVLAVVGSGLAWELTLVVTASGLEYRQSHWLIASACCAAILVGARRRG